MFGRFLLATLTACGPDSGPGTKDHPGKGDDGEPAVTITSPGDGAGSYSDSVPLTWTVDGFTLDSDALGGDAAAGHGHVHVYVDGEKVAESGDDGVTVHGLSEGPHTIEVRLASNDHEELTATDSVDVPVALPSLVVSSPSDGATLSTSNTPLTMAISGFAMSTATTGPNTFDEGHFVVSVDGELHDLGLDPTVAQATGIPEGTHTVRVELVTNDGAPLATPVFAETEVTVLPGATGVYFDRTAFAGPYPSATVPLSLSATGVTLVESDGNLPPVAGQGHFHLFVDGVWLDATADTTRVLQNLTPGPHVFEARLASNDSIETPVLDRLWVFVADDRMDTKITHPGQGWLMAPDFDLNFDTENFTLDPAGIGGENVEHTGHVQVFVDGLLSAETGAAAWRLSALPLGTHVVRVQLANNDRTLVTPEVYSELSVVVQ
jgi:hypothetical protein